MKHDLDLCSLDEDNLDLTPLIDVVFLLLTFFILAATFASPAMEVKLPQAKGVSQTANSENRVTFTITEEGEIFKDREKIDLKEISEVLKALPEETQIVFNVAEKAVFKNFLTVLDEVNSQGRSNFLINANHKRE